MTTTYTCPKCGSSEHIEVIVTVWRRLVQDDPDNIMTDYSTDNSEEWDDDSPASCINCRWIGRVFEFDTGSLAEVV